MTTHPFDENRITLNIGIISDVHIKDEPDRENSEKLRAALRQLFVRSSTGKLDLLMAVGDMCNDGTPKQMATLRQILLEQIHFEETPVLYAMGNHECHTENCTAVKCEIFPECSHGEPRDVAAGRQHITVGGYHILSVDAVVFNRQEGIHYTAETITWLDAQLAAITQEAPGRYVFVQTHALIKDTCYGTDRPPFYQSDDLVELLSRYPQAVTFGGHLHYPLNDERCIMQKDFTAIETAAVSYMLIDAPDFVGMETKSRVPDRTTFSQGLLLQVDATGNLRFTRLDFYRDEIIKQPWELPAPTADGSHLQIYTPARGQIEVTPAPTIAGELKAEIIDSQPPMICLLITCPAASSPDMVRDYTVHLQEQTTGDLHTFRFLSDFYRCPRTKEMAKTCRFPLPPIRAANYRIEVYACDSWGNRSESLYGRIEMI